MTAAVANGPGRRPEHLYQVDAERAAIGLSITRGREAFDVVRTLQPDDFTDDRCRAAFVAIRQLDDAGKLPPADALNLHVLLDAIRAHAPRAFADLQALHGCFLADEPAFGGADAPLRVTELIGRAAMLRVAQGKALAMSNAIVTRPELVDDITGTTLVARAASDFDQLATMASGRGEAMSIAVVADEHDRMIEDRINGEPCEVFYGLKALDMKTDGMDAAEGEFVIVAGRPSMGKTAMTGAIVRAQAVYRADWRGPIVRDPHPWHQLWRPHQRMTPVLYASAESNATQLMTRNIADLCSINTRQIQVPIRRRAGADVEREDRARWERLSPLVHEAKRFVRTWPVRYVERPKVLEEIERQAKGWRHAQPVIGRTSDGKPVRGPAILIVDHLGELTFARGRPPKMNDLEFNTIVVRRLNTLAKALRIVVVLLVQLNRGVESRDDKRPRMSDLRAAGTIEEVADTIITLFRPAYYGRDDKHEGELWERYGRLVELGQGNGAEALKVLAEATHMEAAIEKARNGARGTACMAYINRFTRVVDRVWAD